MSAAAGPLANECWMVTDGVVGLENQVMGLAERLPLIPRTFRVAYRQPWQLLAPYSLGDAFAHLAKQSGCFAAPWPRLLIGSGRHSIPVSRAVKRASGGRTLTVHCEHPHAPARWFDAVIAPMHDQLSGSNVFSILGSPNRITPQRLAAARAEFGPLFSCLRAPRLTVLIGGDSKTHGKLTALGSNAIVSALLSLSRDHGLMVSASRRTPASLAASLKQALAGNGAYLWDGTGANPYFGMLAWADAFLVTGDSVNMICEAASTGKPVHVLPLPGGRERSRIFHELLHQRGITRPFAGRIEQWSYAPLDETARGAAHIKQLLDARAFSGQVTASQPRSDGGAPFRGGQPHHR
jgi:mitochondrial fission protein ELM1